MEIADEIRRMAESKLTDPGQFLVDVVISSRKGPKKVLVLIDGDNGLTIDDCSKLSRELSKTLDDSALLGDDNYMLEVSTPGVDHPLKFVRQYKKNIGRKLKIKLPGDKTLEGKLTEVTEEQITISQEIGTGKMKQITSRDIKFSEIDKAFVLVSFK